MTIFDITIFGLKVAPTYYGLMYALGFLAGYFILKKRKIITELLLDNLVLYIFGGVILGGRLGYILFYNFSYYLQNIHKIFYVWEGGMSFHGGVIGVTLAMFIFCKKNKLSFLKIADNITSTLPIGLGLGRIGNYINKELLGFKYTGFLAVKKGENSYFPSPLLESFLEGIILFFILKYILKNTKTPGKTGGGFLFFYGIFRFIIEFIRIPDTQIGYIFGIITMGQILSLPMILIGSYFLFFRKNEK